MGVTGCCDLQSIEDEGGVAVREQSDSWTTGRSDRLSQTQTFWKSSGLNFGSEPDWARQASSEVSSTFTYSCSRKPFSRRSRLA